MGKNVKIKLGYIFPGTFSYFLSMCRDWTIKTYLICIFSGFNLSMGGEMLIRESDDHKNLSILASLGGFRTRFMSI